MCDFEIARAHYLRVSGYLQEANPKAGSRRRADKGGDADCAADEYPEAEVNFRDRPSFLVFAVGEQVGTDRTCHWFQKVSVGRSLEKKQLRGGSSLTACGEMTSGNAPKSAMQE